MRYLKSLSILFLFAFFAIPAQGQTVHVQGVATVNIQGAEATPSAHAGAFATVRGDTYGLSALGITGKHDRSAYVGPTAMLLDKEGTTIETSVLAGVNQNRGVFRRSGHFDKLAPQKSTLALAAVSTFTQGPIGVTIGATTATGLTSVEGKFYSPDFKRIDRLGRIGVLFGFGFRF